jgi:hypothetical protein
MLAFLGLEPPGLALGRIVASRNLGLLFWGAGALAYAAVTLSRSVRAE